MKKPIRVLHVVGSLGTGGIQSYLMSLYRNIDRAKVQFDFVVHIPTENGYEKEVHALGGLIYYIDDNAFVNNNWITYIKFWKKFYRNHPEYKVVHGHIRTTSAIYLTIAKKYHRYTIAHSHANSNGYGKGAIVKDILQFPTRYIADYFMGCSKAASEWMFGAKVAKSKECQVMYNAIDVDKFSYDSNMRNRVREELGISDCFVIGSVGRMVAQKNQIIILEALKKILEEIPTAKLLLVGDGPLMETLVNKAIELEIKDKVLFLGSRKDVPALLQAMDVFTLSSKDEGLGIAAIEAQAAGLPTIVSRAIQEEVYITNLCMQVESDTSDGWKTSVCNCINVERKNMSDDVIKAGYSIKDVAEKISNFYMEHY